MEITIQYPQCGADCSDGQTCTDFFHLMGIGELDNQLFDVHHLMVLCYHLQQSGVDNYYDNMRQWATSTLKSLQESGNID
jgi:hypothetical protein